MKTKVIILAAGCSTRFQGNKLLHPLHNKPMIQYIFDTVFLLQLEVIVVTQYEEVKTLAKRYAYQIIDQPHPEEGISSSLRLGLQASISYDQVLFIVADQPWLTLKTLQRIVQQGDKQHIIAASINQQPRNPMLFPKCMFQELMQLKKDEGGKQIIKRHQEQMLLIEVPEVELLDIDTKEDLNNRGYDYGTK